MTKYALIGDPHVGNFSRFGGVKKLGMNRRCELTVKALRDALLRAVAEKADYAVILGDLFDSMKPEPQLIDTLRQTFRAFAKDLQIILLKGNHDSASDEPRDTALYAVIEKHVIVVDQPRILREADPYQATQGPWKSCNPPLVLVPFRSGPVIEWLPGLLEELHVPTGAILCLHAGIKDEETAPWLLGAPDAIEMSELDALMDKHGIDLVFAGNWHEQRNWPHEGIFQVGALCPTGFSNLGTDEYGHVKVVSLEAGDNQAFVQDHYIAGPRFLKLGPDDMPTSYLPEEHNDRLFIEWKVNAESLHAARAELDQLTEQGLIEGGIALPDTSQATEGLRQAALAAKHTVGIAEAVGAFVAKLQMPPLADRESVHARIRAYTGLE